MSYLLHDQNMTIELYNEKKTFACMISEINWATIDNINEVRIRYFNYAT